jgi:hypothetical protein
MTTGGEAVFIYISNECSTADSFECRQVSGATDVMTPIVAQMTDNNDGTYSYTYSVTKEGKVTVAVAIAVK